MSPAGRSILAPAVALVVLLGPACGGVQPNDRQPARDYVRATCMGIGGWLEDIVARNQELERELPPIQDPEVARQMLVDYFGDLVTVTRELRILLQALAPPAVEDGADVHDRIVSGVEGAERVIGAALVRAEDLPIDDLEALNAEAREIGAEVRDASGEIGGSFEDLLTTELAAAIAAEPACQELSGIPSPD
jgi:hypothetical protein